MKKAKKKAEKLQVAIIGTYGHSLPLDDLKKMLPKGKVRLIVGAEDSADYEVTLFAIAYNYRLKRMIPENEGKSAVYENIRNVIQSADKVLIFWDGVSERTVDAIKECVSMKKDFNVYTTFHKS